MNYKAIYQRVLDSNNVELENQINEVLYNMMMSLPDPELWEILEGVNPSSQMEVIFLDAVNTAFTSPAEMLKSIQDPIGELDFNKFFLILWDGSCQTVDQVRDIECGWDEVFDDALESGLIWGYVPHDDATPEDIEKFNRLFEEAERVCPSSQVWTSYCPDTDITYIMEEDARTITCIGWYFGEPNDFSTEMFSHKSMTAHK